MRIRLDDASIEGPDGRVLLRPTTIAFGAGVTTLVGPSATGKSLLLRALAKVALPQGFVARGNWPNLDREVIYVSQRSGASIEQLGSDALLVLDEPDRSFGSVGGAAADRDALVAAIRGREALVVTHDLSFARAVSDEIVLLCAGAIVAHAPVEEFFMRPPNELASRYLRDGNCWPSAPKPVLPVHFRWLEHERIAGMGRPGLLRDVEEDLYAVALAGVTTLVSLTEEPFPLAPLKSFGIAGHHFPIRDMDVPAVGRAMVLCRTITRAIAAGDRVAVHCHAGLGRTGSILAAYLVWNGHTSSDAIVAVRALEPKMIQNRAQENFVRDMGQALGR